MFLPSTLSDILDCYTICNAVALKGGYGAVSDTRQEFCWLS